MKTKTKVKSGSLIHNHNEVHLCHAAPDLKVQTNVSYVKSSYNFNIKIYTFRDRLRMRRCD